MSLYYIASPYTSPDEAVRHSRYESVMRYVAWVLKNRPVDPVPFSPILYCHEMAKAHALPTDYQFWLDFNMAIMRSSPRIEVLMLPGWEQSKGVAVEIIFARDNRIPLFFAKPLGTDSYDITSAME